MRGLISKWLNEQRSRSERMADLEVTNTPGPSARPAISCRDISVSIPVFQGGSRSFRTGLIQQMVGGRVAAAGGVTLVRALESISFDVFPGESIGILGHNGAGKTTLLNVLAGIYEPTTGSVEINGHPTPFFGVDEGVDAEMTGYEAIEIGGLVRGLHYRELAATTQQAEDFTELGEFLRLPIRTYSAGMYARLMFAIATCVRPEILLVDENISAGDERFQAKVRARVTEYVAGASTFFMASHDSAMLSDWCEKGLLLNQGRVVYFGTIDEAIRRYDHGAYLPDKNLTEDGA